MVAWLGGPPGAKLWCFIGGATAGLGYGGAILVDEACEKGSLADVLLGPLAIAAGLGAWSSGLGWLVGRGVEWIGWASVGTGTHYGWLCGAALGALTGIAGWFSPDRFVLGPREPRPRKSREKGPLHQLRELPILAHDFGNWRAYDMERQEFLPAWDSERIIEKQSGMSATEAADYMRAGGEWGKREFDRVWSSALGDWVRVEWMGCLSRYRFQGDRREITRIFRYGEDRFARTVQVD